MKPAMILVRCISNRNMFIAKVRQHVMGVKWSAKIGRIINVHKTTCRWQHAQAKTVFYAKNVHLLEDSPRSSNTFCIVIRMNLTDCVEINTKMSWNKVQATTNNRLYRKTTSISNWYKFHLSVTRDTSKNQRKHAIRSFLIFDVLVTHILLLKTELIIN